MELLIVKSVSVFTFFFFYRPFTKASNEPRTTKKVPQCCFQFLPSILVCVTVQSTRYGEIATSSEKQNKEPEQKTKIQKESTTVVNRKKKKETTSSETLHSPCRLVLYMWTLWIPPDQRTRKPRHRQTARLQKHAKTTHATPCFSSSAAVMTILVHTNITKTNEMR